MSDAEYCDLGPCSALAGHDGTCAEASGDIDESYDEYDELLDRMGDIVGTPLTLPDGSEIWLHTDANVRDWINSMRTEQED